MSSSCMSTSGVRMKMLSPYSNICLLICLNSDFITAAKKGEGKDQCLTVGEMKRWMIQILSGMDVCHRSSIVHRDLKPTGLFISADGVVKLADFGQARILLAPGFVAVRDDFPPNDISSPNGASENKPLEANDMLGYTDQETQFIPQKTE